jgi:hyperosmotically inducible protein
VKHWFKISLITAALAVVPVIAQTADTKAVDTSRDARNNGPTADNQKNNKTDLKTTQNIRKAIVDDKSLSTTAHNVKVITRNGTVTLRGRVHSDDERKAIVSKAEEVAGHGNVTDELKLSAAKMKDTQPDK